MVQKDQHIERSSLCTVFLDTLLVNAHTVGRFCRCFQKETLGRVYQIAVLFAMFMESGNESDFILI
jgi:hypothetical protein